GLYGVIDSLPAVVALPSGVWLAGHGGLTGAVIFTAATALVPLAVFPWPPRTADPRQTARPRDAGKPLGLLAGLGSDGQLRLALTFAATTVAAGVIVSFLPLAAGVSGNIAATGLLAQALTATAGRWWAGRHGDLHGHAGLLFPGLAMAA